MTKLEPGLAEGSAAPPAARPLPFNTDAALATPTNVSDWPLIPWARGPLSTAVIDALQRGRSAFGPPPSLEHVDVLTDDDFQLALYLCYETSYREFNATDWRRDAGLQDFRTQLERFFESRLRVEVERWEHGSGASPLRRLDELLDYSRMTLLARFVSEFGTLEHLRELCVHQSVIHVHEDDSRPLVMTPSSGAVPVTRAHDRFSRREKDRDGRGVTAQLSDTMTALGLDPSSGSYVEMAPGPTLALLNLTSMFADQEKFRAAYLGQLAAAVSSSAASREPISRALGKFGIDALGRRFFDNVASVDPRLARIARDRGESGYLETELDSLLFGATAMRVLEGGFVTHLLAAWERKATSLAPWVMSD
ncbi:MAG: iron-containing redox enzyme family protein [Acidobacteria bacterium]|nr:iron-containing redox enzyme family protein [Acidobacteriota bacterium]